MEVERSEEKWREVMTCDVSPVAMFFYFTKQEIVEAVDTSNNTKEIRFEFRFTEQLPS